MNILVTLPKHLVEKILSGDKRIEVRKCHPRRMSLGVDGFFVVEKGTDNIRCWCRVDRIVSRFIDPYSAGSLAIDACVSRGYIEKYANGHPVYLWYISKVKAFYGLRRDSLHVDKNPQQFSYCTQSHGESLYDTNQRVGWRDSNDGYR